MFPGLTAVAAAVLGLLRPADRRRVAYGVLLILAFDLSLGAYGFLYTTLYRTVWVYRGLRVPERMFVMFSVGLATPLLAGKVVDEIGRGALGVVVALAGVIAAVAVAEAGISLVTRWL